MKQSKKSISLQSFLTIVLITLFLIVMAVLVLGFNLYKSSYQKKIVESQIEKQKQTIQSNYDEILSHLILEQAEGLNHVLKKIERTSPSELSFVAQEKIASSFSQDQFPKISENFFILELPIYGLDKEHFGNIIVKTPIDLSEIKSLNKVFYIFLASSCLFLLLIIFVIRWIFHKHLYTSLQKIINRITTSYESSSNQDLSSGGIFSEVQTLNKQILEMSKKLSKISSLEAIAKTTSQVSHDIRSPLAALKVISTDLPEVSEEKRLLLKMAVQRIEDIANDLSSRKNEIKKTEKETSEKEDTYHVQSLIEALVSEKRLQYRAKLNIHIQTHFDDKSYLLFALVNLREMKRVLSNLINNSIEAFGDEGVVSITLSKGENNKLKIQVSDNGKGIPEDKIDKIFERGISHDKPQGTGLGLFHAKTTIESWNGKINIESNPDAGTTIQITLPKAQPPKWFLEKFTITNGTNLVILDDDPSVHEIWNKRFKTTDTQIQNFSTPGEFTTWRKTNGHVPIIMCTDYEFLGTQDNGLNVISEYQETCQCILVTSHYEDPSILNECLEKNIKLIPKPLVGFVPLDIN